MKSIWAIPVLASILILGSLGLTQQASATTVFFTDFDAGAPSEFSGITTTESVQDFDTVGDFAGDFLRNRSGDTLGFEPPPNPVPVELTRLTLTGLPPHTGVDVNFLLAIIDTWDGTATVCGVGNGPDVFNVRVDGVLIFRETFDNTALRGVPCGFQSYVPPAGVELARLVDLGFLPGSTGCCGPDSAYNMGLDPTFENIPHTSATLTIDWFTDSRFTGNGDESWAIDNVEILLRGVEPPPIPVEIDIKPGSDPNSVNCKANKKGDINGVVPVAIFGAENFDVIDIEIVQMSLVSSGPITVIDVHNQLHLEDVNDDGLLDRLLHIKTSDICFFIPEGTPIRSTIEITLSGETTGGQAFEGSDNIVLKGKKILEN